VNFTAPLLPLVLMRIVTMSRLCAAFDHESLPWCRDATSMTLLHWLAASRIVPKTLPMLRYICMAALVCPRFLALWQQGSTSRLTPRVAANVR